MLRPLIRPIVRPLVRPLVRGVTEPGYGGRRFTYYVDSVNGDDLNDGLTADTAFQTIGKLDTTLSSDYSGQRIGLARGSYWREEIGGGSNASVNVVIDAYGSGQLPVLDGADVVAAASWAKTATYTNVYDLTWAHSAAVGSTLSVWEDGVRLRWVASAALCDATAGTYYCASVAGATTAVYLHATGSGDPDANGKLYEISARESGLTASASGASWNVARIRTRRQTGPNGSLVLQAPGSVARECVAEDGTKHNLFIGADCSAYDCIAWLRDWHDRTNTAAFVAFVADGTGKTARFVRCVSVCDPSVVEVARAAAAAIGGFIAHTASDAGKWAGIEYTDCSVNAATNGFSASNVTSYTVTRCYATDYNSAVSANGAASIVDCYFKEGATVLHNNVIRSFSGTTTIEGLRCYFSDSSTLGALFTNVSGCEISVTKSVLWRASAGAGWAYFVRGDVAGTIVNSTRNIIGGNLNTVAYRRKGGGSADYNVFYPGTIDFEIGASSYSSFALYQAAELTFDQNSVAADPLLVDPANGDFNVAEGSPAIALCAGLERPNITYTAIPSDAEIEAM